MVSKMQALFSPTLPNAGVDFNQKCEEVGMIEEGVGGVGNFPLFLLKQRRRGR